MAEQTLTFGSPGRGKSASSLSETPSPLKYQAWREGACEALLSPLHTTPTFFLLAHDLGEGTGRREEDKCKDRVLETLQGTAGTWDGQMFTRNKRPGAAGTLVFIDYSCVRDVGAGQGVFPGTGMFSKRNKALLQGQDDGK